MSCDNLSSVSQNVLKFYLQLTGEERRIPFIFDDFHFCRSRVIGPVQPISITKTLRIVPTKNERDPPLFTGKLLIKFQNILRNTTQGYTCTFAVLVYIYIFIAPQKPLNVTGVATSDPKTLQVRWQQPLPRPGITNYTVKVYEENDQKSMFV
jgi:hypothetical protein